MISFKDWKRDTSPKKTKFGFGTRSFSILFLSNEKKSRAFLSEAVFLVANIWDHATCMSILIRVYGYAPRRMVYNCTLGKTKTIKHLNQTEQNSKKESDRA